MVSKTENGYKCSICGMLYERDTLALSCEQAHDIIYVAFHREDLFKLVQFIYTQDKSLLSESLINTIMKYSRGSYV